MNILTITTGEETVDISFTDEAGEETNIVRMNHDDYGWGPMSSITSALEKLARLAGMQVEHRDVYGNEE